MWIALENGHLLNTDMVSNVEFREHGSNAGKASCWGYGIILAADSRIAYRHFKPLHDEALERQARKEEKPTPDVPVPTA